MTKLALITDTHWGVRGDNVAFLDNSKKFLDEIFFPYIDGHNISTVIHLGDIVDRRKYININTARRLRVDFLDKLNERNLDIHLIAGNHDTYFKNTNEVNAIKELVENAYPSFKTYTKHAESVNFGGIPILFIPWVCDDNRKQVLDAIQTSPAQIAMGHLEISGFEMFKGSVVSHGDDRSIYNKFDIVMSGHFHHRSTDGHIVYLGSHGEFTWSDFDDPRGFHVFDTETRELTFIENPYKMFKKIWYNDSDDIFLQKKIDYSQYKNCLVKVIVTNKTNLYWFDKFIENLEEENPIDIQIVEDHLNLDLEDDNDIINEAESTLDIFKKYIDTYEIKNMDKNKLSKKIVELYNEAISIG
jgi:DNA repair exonuclease SbcCD nuclease subunit